MLATVNVTGQYMTSLQRTTLYNTDLADAFNWENIGLTDGMNSNGLLFTTFPILTVSIDQSDNWVSIPIDSTSNVSMTDQENAAYDAAAGGTPPVLMLGGFWGAGDNTSEQSSRSQQDVNGITYWDNQGNVQTSYVLASPIAYYIRVFQEVYAPMGGTGYTFYRVRCEVPAWELPAFYPPNATAAEMAIIRERLRVEIVFQQRASP
jgi:hypothetical protein